MQQSTWTGRVSTDVYRTLSFYVHLQLILQIFRRFMPLCTQPFPNQILLISGERINTERVYLFWKYIAVIQRKVVQQVGDPVILSIACNTRKRQKRTTVQNGKYAAVERVCYDKRCIGNPAAPLSRSWLDGFSCFQKESEPLR